MKNKCTFVQIQFKTRKMKIEEQKQLFKNMSDCYADTWYLNEDGVYVEGEVIQAMTEERFVKAVSEVTSSASGDASDERFSDTDMISFGNFIRDNYYGVGAPKLISYNHIKYPHGAIDEIFLIWRREHKRNKISEMYESKKIKKG